LYFFFSIQHSMYKQIAIPFFFLVVAAFSFFIIYQMMRPKSGSPSKRSMILSLLFLWYLCGVAAMTIVPISASRTQNLDHHFNFVPLVKSYDRYFYVQQVNDPEGIRNFRNNFFGNIALFIPMGVFLPLLYRKKFWKTIFIAGSASCGIEFIQYLNMTTGYYRFVDIDDVILNTLGAIIGYWLFKVFTDAGKNRRI
jgi:glycopeptide antibiotics resistance protein